MTGIIGKAIDRVDGPAKTTGRALFAAEFPYDGIAHAALTYATIPRGRVVAIDTQAACAVRGVIAVVTHRNAPVMRPPPKPNPMSLDSLASGTSVAYLNTDEVHWDGQPIAVSVAETLEAAQYAAELVDVTYEPGPSAVDFAAEASKAVPQQGNFLQHADGKKGDADAALAAAPVSVDLRFTTPRYHHNALEPHATTAIWNGNRLTVHEATQSMGWVRSLLAHAFSIPATDI